MKFRSFISNATGVSLVRKIFSLSRNSDNYIVSVIDDINNKANKKNDEDFEISKEKAYFNFRFSMFMVYSSYTMFALGSLLFAMNTNISTETTFIEFIVRITSLIALIIFSLSISYRFAVINFFSRCFYLEVDNKEESFKKYTEKNLIDLLFPTKMELKN